MRSSFQLELVILNMMTSAVVTVLVLAFALNFLPGGSLPNPFGGRSNLAALTASQLPAADKTVEDIVANASPAVVSITAIRETSTEENEELWWLRWFDDGAGVSERTITGSGSGFIVSPDGHIITNRHVVEGATQLIVTRSDNETYVARIIMAHDELDLAVIDIDATDLPTVALAREPVRVGQSVVAIGNALSEFTNSVSAGVVSGVERSIVAADSLGRHESLEHLIQTDAAINPGNSGGPLLNRQGEVVGVNVAIAEGYENIGFALPAPLVREVTGPFLNHQP